MHIVVDHDKDTLQPGWFNLWDILAHAASVNSGRKILELKTESVLKKYLIVPAYLNCRNDLNVVLNFSVDIIRFRRQKLHTEIFSIQYTEKWKLKNQAQI